LFILLSLFFLSIFDPILDKGLTKSEIAEKMKVNESTISRDLNYLKQEAKRQIWEHFDKDILFEYYRYLGRNDEISKKLWEIVQDNKTSTNKKQNVSCNNANHKKRCCSQMR
jgi:DNA-binding transcriptional regulator LsrR (DeoR family)